MAENPAEEISSLPCSECGKLVEPERKFCPHCGTPQHPESEQQVPPLLCLSCGGDLLAEAAFCGACGTRVWHEGTTPTFTLPVQRVALSSPPPVEVESPPVARPQVATQIRTLLVGAGAGLGVIALVGLGLLLGRVVNPPPVIEQPPISVPLPDTPPPPPPPAPLPQAQGQVITADGLFAIRVFGEAANNPVRLADGIKERIEGSLAGIRSAYEKELEASPNLLGVLIVEMTIAADGHVSRVASYATSLPSQEFQRTVRDLAQDWRFEPTTTGEVNVFYPLLFAPADVDPRALTSFVNEVIPGRYKIIAAEPVPVREEPTKNAKQLGEIKPGLKVNIVGSQGGWLGIVSPQGKIGYLPREAISSKVEAQ